MTRLIVLTIATSLTAVAAFAASEAMTSAPAEVIQIEVSADELARCEQTLRDVGQMPAVTDSGSPILFGSGAEDMPRVECTVVGEA
mgnify:CR=1 FL=1